MKLLVRIIKRPFLHSFANTPKQFNKLNLLFTGLHLFNKPIRVPVPETFAFLIDGKPHPLCVLAAEQLQAYLSDELHIDHNFGLAESDGPIIGKMFGVLVVRNTKNEIGFLAAFSGKMAGTNDHSMFVPPVYDLLEENSFLNIGMAKLNRLNEEIRSLEKANETDDRLEKLRADRKNFSNALQMEIFDHYHFLNSEGKSKSLREIFSEAAYKNPPAGAGECAGPKLFQYAHRHRLEPLAIAEFWWGQSPKSATWIHGNYYAPCKEKCEPILGWMMA